MAMRMKRVLYSVVALCALAGALYVPARAAGLKHRDRDNRRLECGVCRRNVDLRAIGERVPQAGRSLRQTGPGH